MEYGGGDTPRPGSHGADYKGSEPVPREGSGFVMVASDATSTGSPILGLVAADSPQAREVRLRTWRRVPDLRPERELEL